MVDLHSLLSLFLEAAGSLGLVILMVACKQIASALSTKYLSQADLQKIEALSVSAAKAVRAADQKIGNASDFVTAILGDKPTRNDMTDDIIKWNDTYKTFKASTDDQKKKMVMDFLEAKFPDVPVEEIEIHLEQAYQEYKKTGV